MHLCVCLITLISPLRICNPSNLTVYRLLALLQRSFTDTRDKQCACCIRGEHKPAICTCFIEVIYGFLNSLILDSFCQQGSNPDVYLLMCPSSFSSLYVTYVYNLISSLFSGASLGPAQARRLFLRGNFLI